MKIAVATYHKMVASTYDFSSEVTIYSCENDQVLERECYIVNDQFMPLRARKLQDMGVRILICGVIANPTALLMKHQQIDVVSGISGEADAVITAYLNDTLDNREFKLPGYEKICCGRRRRNRRQCGRRNN